MNKPQPIMSSNHKVNRPVAIEPHSTARKTQNLSQRFSYEALHKALCGVLLPTSHKEFSADLVLGSKHGYYSRHHHLHDPLSLIAAR
ncbi:MAG: hypothetical protein ACI8PP_002356 [Candidatus Pseudothioglobus sp.]|jgi:hypothetical protein